MNKVFFKYNYEDIIIKNIFIKYINDLFWFNFIGSKKIPDQITLTIDDLKELLKVSNLSDVLEQVTFEESSPSSGSSLYDSVF